MPMQTDRARRLILLAAFLVPSLGVLTARLVGTGPANASASLTPEPMAALPDIRPIIDTVPSDPIHAGTLTSPFWHSIQTPNTPIEVLRPIQPTETRPDPDPEFRVTAVMPHPSRPLAVINGRPRSIGDTVVPNWKLTAIDGTGRSVVLTHTSGREVTLHIGTTQP